MTINYHSTYAAQWNGTLGSTVDLPNCTASIDDVVLVAIAADNLASGDGDFGEHTVTDPSGNSYKRILMQTNGQGAAAAGVSLSVHLSVITTALSNATITGTIRDTAGTATNVTVRIIGGMKITKTQARVDAVVKYSLLDASGIVSINTDVLTSDYWLYVAIRGCEIATSGAPTNSGTNWYEFADQRTGSGAAGIELYGELLSTALGTQPVEASLPVLSGTFDQVSCIIALRDAPAFPRRMLFPLAGGM